LTTNIDKTVHAGLETLGSLSVPVGARHRIDPLISLTINRFNFDDDPVYGSRRLPAAPTFAARGEVMYRHAGGVYFGPTFDLIGERFADFSNTYLVGGHELLGLRAGLSAARWELFGEIRNLLDEDYIATIGVLNVAGGSARVLYPGAPRSIYLGARLSL
jgi:iron complex outermembrane receptor protein